MAQATTYQSDFQNPSRAARSTPLAHSGRALAAGPILFADCATCSAAASTMEISPRRGQTRDTRLQRNAHESHRSEYACRIPSKQVGQLLGFWHEHVIGEHVFDGESLNLDFYSAPYYGEDPIVEKHFVSMRSRSSPGILVFLAQGASARVFCCSNADICKGEESDEVLRFVTFWKKRQADYPNHLVFDSKLTTYANLARLNQLGISSITLQRRSPKMLKEIDDLLPSPRRKVDFDVATRKFRTPRVFE